MGRPLRAIKRRAVLVRMEPDQWAMIDKAAGDMPRHDWIVKTLLGAAEPKPVVATPVVAKPVPAAQRQQAAAKTSGVQFGPTRAEPGRRLKRPK